MSDTPQENTVRELAPRPQQSFSLTPKSLDEAMKFADMIAKSDICPKDFKGNAGNVLVAIQYGMELGIPPLQALQNIAVINGRPCVWGDALPALAYSNPQFEYLNETFNEQTMTATCVAKRKGKPDQTFTFSQSDAQTAKLWGKPGPWTQYPKRMLKMRARGFAIRDVFPDSLKGLAIAEEVRDYAPIDITDRSEVVSQKPLELPAYTDEQFDTNYPSWINLIESGKKTADQIIAMVNSKYTMTEEQKTRITNLGAPKKPEPQTIEQPAQEDDDWSQAYDNEINRQEAQ